MNDIPQAEENISPINAKIEENKIKISNFIDLLQAKLQNYSSTDVENSVLINVFKQLYSFLLAINDVTTQTGISIIARKTEYSIKNFIYNRLNQMPSVNFYTITKPDFENLYNILQDLHRPRFKYNSETDTLVENNRVK